MKGISWTGAQILTLVSSLPSKLFLLSCLHLIGNRIEDLEGRTEAQSSYFLSFHGLNAFALIKRAHKRREELKE